MKNDKNTKKNHKEIKMIYFHIIQKLYMYIYIGKINEIYILINEKSNRKIPRFFKISRDTSRTKIEPGSQELIT